MSSLENAHVSPVSTHSSLPGLVDLGDALPGEECCTPPRESSPAPLPRPPLFTPRLAGLSPRSTLAILDGFQGDIPAETLLLIARGLATTTIHREEAHARELET